MDFVSQIKSAFSDELPSCELFVFDTVGSTNDEARAYAVREKNKNAFFIAREQTFGRGRRGRSFISREGGLYISYLLHPHLAVKDAVSLTVFAAVALCETIEEITNSKPKIKWVNDVFLGKKKLAGILAEGSVSESGDGFEYAVVGIGINLNGTRLAPEIENIATTLELETGESVDIPSFALCLAKKLEAFEKKGISSYIDEYRRRSLVLGKRIRMTSASEEFFAEALRIEDDGAISVKLDTGEVKAFYSGEISLMPI